MTDYVNPSTRLNGAKQIIVPRQGSSGEMQEAPFDNDKYVRQNGMWVAESDFPEAPANGKQYVRKDEGWVVGDFSQPSPYWVLPEPIVHLAQASSVSITSSTWTTIGTSLYLPLDRDVMMLMSLKGLPSSADGTHIRVRLFWNGATVGNSYTLFGNNWAGCLSAVGIAFRNDASVTFPLKVNSGMTVFRAEGQRSLGTAAGTVADLAFTLTPVGWADHYG